MPELSFEQFVNLSPTSTDVEATIKARKLGTRDANLVRNFQSRITPEMRAADDETDMTLANMNELEQEISKSKGNKRRILVEEHNRLKGEIEKRFPAENPEPPANPRNKYPRGMTGVRAAIEGGLDALIPSAQAAEPQAGVTQNGPAGGKAISFEQFASGGDIEKNPELLKMRRQEAFHGVLDGFKNLGGSSAVLADMILSTPGMMLGVGANIGAQAYAFGAGEPGKIQAGAGRAAQEWATEHTTNPLQALMKMFKSGEAYETSAGAKGMKELGTLIQRAGQWVETNTNGRVPAEQVETLVDTLMAGGMIRGMDHGIVKGTEALIKRGQAEPARPTISPVETAAKEAAAPLNWQQQINDTLGIRTPKEQAKWNALRKRQVNSAMREPAEGSDYGSIDESQFRADERMRNHEDYWMKDTVLAEPTLNEAHANDTVARVKEAIQPPTWAEAMRVLRKPEGQRTPKEVLKLKAFERWGEQAGSVDPEFLGWVAAAGVTAGAATYVYDRYKKSGQSSFLEFLKDPNAQPPREIPDAAPEPTQEGTFLTKGDIPKWLVGSALIAGAVKAKGGMWHPEAVERLSQPLGEKLVMRSREHLANIRADQPIKYSDQVLADVAKDETTWAWSDKAIRNYLNKYAGTERDPIKDVQIPYGGETKSLGEVSDGAFKPVTGRQLRRYEVMQREDFDSYAAYDANDKQASPTFKTLSEAQDWAREYQPGLMKEFEKVGRDEKVWGTGLGHKTSVEALTSYLSHVGDYLRQNVAPEKLGQYDLVRAVRETSANDARVAKEMAKASAASTASLPIHKDYGNGFKWVELKMPEKLTEEQARGVNLASIGDKIPLHEGESLPYYAVDASGKPVKNTYTGENASGRTPEEAHLAGQLAQEGNQMGHCVGGYCQGVASGESRIFSLRDKEGKSHVTVEVEPVKGIDVRGYSSQTASPKMQLEGENITQIKGKQNRAPNAEYLPYVQDFVKSGKWGEVGDLQNTGLYRLDSTPHDLPPSLAAHSQRNRLADAANRMGQRGERFATREDILKEAGISNTLAIPKGERGSVDIQTLAKIAGVGTGALIGAALSDKDSITGAALGAVLAGLGMSIPYGKVVKGADWGLGLLSTRIRNISPALHHRAVEYERRVLESSYNWLSKADPFLVELNKEKGPEAEKLNRAILTNDSAQIQKSLVALGNVDLAKGWVKVRELLDDIGGKLKAVGRIKESEEGYFPRLVRDREGLLSALGTTLKTALEERLNAAELKAMKTRGSELSAAEEANIINQFLREKRYGSNQPGYAKGRKIEEITADLEPYYATPTESLHAYIRNAAQDLEKAKFFGRDQVAIRKAGLEYINEEASIGNVVQREVAARKLTYKQAEELTSLLRDRFGPGERTPSGIIQDAKNLANAGLLGNVISAATQLGDLFTTVYMYGILPTVTNVAKVLTGRPGYRMKDFGLVNHISEEFVSTRASARFLNATFKYGGFSSVDALGKNVNLNAAAGFYQRLAQTTKGVEQIAEKYSEAYGPEFNQLIADLRTKQQTPLVRSLLFHELSDTQPITRLEMPQGYLQNPNGRVVYMLKSFMLKQADLARREGYNEIKKGNILKGVGNLLKLGVALGLNGATTDMVKDYILGRPFDAKWTDIPMNMLKTFGWSEYTLDKARQGHPIEAAVNTVVPPYKMMDDIIRLDPKAIRYVPIVGRLFYEHALGGKEKHQEKLDRDEIKKLNKEFR